MKKFKMPSALVIVFLFLMVVAVLTWFIPTSVAVTDESGVTSVIYNAAFDAEGNVVENAGPSPAGLWDVLMAPIKGFQASSDVGFSILISGSFLGIMNYVGALDAGIGALLKRFSGKSLITILMLVFALMGTVYGSWEELPAYALVVIPLFVKAGYDVLTGIGVLFIGAAVGNMASVVNPYSTGAAVAAIGNPDLSLGSGIALRILLFVVLYLVALFLMLRYAEKVKADKSASYVAGLPVKTLVDENQTQLPELTPRRKWSLAVFFVMIFLVVMGYIPWSAIAAGEGTLYDVVNAPAAFLSQVAILGNLLGAGSATYFADWYFDEFSIVFLGGSIVVAFINKMSEAEFVRQFIKGAEELLGVVMVLAVAKGIALMMGSSTYGMSLTFVYWIQNLLQSVPIWAFVIATVAAYILIGVFLQSTSGVSGITMPILGAVAMALYSTSAFGAVGGQVMLISAFTLGLNFVSGFYPSATVMGVIELANVPYNNFFKFMMRTFIPLLILGSIVISVAPYLGLAQ